MIGEFTLRLCMAGVLGAMIGLEREYRAKEAGFRTHFLVSLGSALIMIVSQYAFSEILTHPNVSLDPSRVAAGVVTGIGFIGVGTIIIQKQVVRGLTTAAGLWVTSGIGLAVGGGMYWIGAIATGMTLLGMELLTILFKKIGLHSSFIKFTTENYENVQHVMEMIVNKGCRIVSYEARKEITESKVLYHVDMVVKTRNNIEEGQIFRYIHTLPDLMIERIE